MKRPELAVSRRRGASSGVPSRRATELGAALAGQAVTGPFGGMHDDKAAAISLAYLLAKRGDLA
jgi:hypothetical protein